MERIHTSARTEVDRNMNGPLQLTVIRRVRLREDLNPVKAYWNFGLPAPDWVVT